MTPISNSRDISLADLPGMDSPVTALYSPSPSKDRRDSSAPGSASGFSRNENQNDMNILSSPVPRGMDPQFYTQDFSGADPSKLVTEIEGRQAGDPHGTTAAYRHLVKVLVKRLGSKPDAMSIKTAEKRQVERALDNARLEVDAQANTIKHLKTELTERKEHERLNQHSITLLDAKLGEKVREALFTSNELDALRRHNQALVDAKTGIESQLETMHARMVERNSYVVELEAKGEDLAAKLQAERRSRHEEAAAAAAEHGKDQSLISELTRTVESMRKGLSHTQRQLDEWESAEPKATVSDQLTALVKAAQEEAAASAAMAEAAEARANAAIAAAAEVPSLKTVMLLSIGAWPIIVTILLYIAFCVYANANPGTTYTPFAEYVNGVGESMSEVVENVSEVVEEMIETAEEALNEASAEEILQDLGEL